MCRCCCWDSGFDRRRWKFAKAEPSLRAEACRTDRHCRARARIAESAAITRHGLRIDAGSLRQFSRHVGLLPGAKAQQLAAVANSIHPSEESHENYDSVATLTPLGRQQVFDLTEPTTHSFVANGLTVHNCSEYMFLDDTACNLASLNVLKFFDAETKQFDIAGYKHGDFALDDRAGNLGAHGQLPQRIDREAVLSLPDAGSGIRQSRGHADAGGHRLRQRKRPGDLRRPTAILTGESYATSAEMAASWGLSPVTTTTGPTCSG